MYLQKSGIVIFEFITFLFLESGFKGNKTRGRREQKRFFQLSMLDLVVMEKRENS